MHRLAQGLALCLSIGLLTFLACRAQPSSPPAPTGNAAAGPVDGGAPDAAAAATPEVYLPASKSGGFMLDQQGGK